MTLLDWPFIERLEGGIVLRGYVPTDSSGAPLGQSGVTIGSGVDLGHWTEAQLRRRRVPADTIDLVRPFLGLRGWKALDVARDLRLSHQQAETLTRCIQGDIVDAVRDRYDAAIKPGMLKWHYLSSAPKTVIVSVAFQYGPALNRRCPTFWKHAIAQDWPAMVAELRDFGDRYPTRRNKEADYLESSLKGD